MEPTDQKKLFTEFPPTSTKDWETKITTDLKGADYEKKLIWKTEEGFDVRPYYRSEDLQVLEYLSLLPGEYPYVRGNKTNNNNWLIRQDYHTGDFLEANRLALDAVARGADAVGFNAKEVTTHKEMHRMLDNIDLSKIDINFISSRSFPLTLELFIYEVTSRKTETDRIKGSINYDPISFLLLHGDFYVSWRNNLEEAEYLLNAVNKHLPLFKVLTVNGHYFLNAGSTLVQELAFSLASACEYMVGLSEKGFSFDKIAPRFMLSLGAGTNFFMEIAKLRAARFLWAKMAEQFHPEEPGSTNIFINSSTATWNKTIYDSYLNLLRTTTEGMSSALGNADSVTIHPFDVMFREGDDFSRRIALNQQLIFKEESYLNKIVDPAAGSYYLESLTDSIIFHAWKLFLEVEERGGMIESIKSGFIQKEILNSREQKETDIDRRKIVLIGTNQYPNLQENMLEKIEQKKETPGNNQSTYQKISSFKGSHAFDEIRLATEKFVSLGNKRPSVFLLPMGNLAMLRARAGFATNFFGCAGYEIIDNTGFLSVEEAIKAALSSEAEIIVICSSDEEYPEIAPEICRKVKAADPKRQLIVAGYPKDSLEMLKNSGIDDFIHIRSNLLTTLKKYQAMLGLE